MAVMSPMMQQYFKIKEQHKDQILFSVWVIFMKCFMMTQKLPRGN